MVNRRRMLAMTSGGLVASIIRPTMPTDWQLGSSAMAAEPGGLSAKDVEDAISEGVRYLKSQQDKRGHWKELPGYDGGVTALVTLALLSCGEQPDDPSVDKAIKFLRNETATLNRTYCTALKTMVYATANPEGYTNLIQGNVNWLQLIQVKSGASNGAWGYGKGSSSGDKSNTQFALLALYEAERAGFKVSEPTWNRALSYWQRGQEGNGAWRYPPHLASGSMTCAGIASLLICSDQISKGDARVVNDKVQCCGAQEENDDIEKGLDWLAQHFSVGRNPGGVPGSERLWWFYYLYALERVGRLSGRRFIGNHDWYREGAEMLVRNQEPAGSWLAVGIEKDRHIATAYALLFLSKGRRPVLVSKLRRQADWNYHRNDLARLTRHVEKRWKKDMTWQTIDIGAPIEDLVQTPVLFISGRDGLQLNQKNKDKLVQYVQSGGFIFAENCCGGEGFDRDFRQFVRESFADSSLRLLPPNHPVWFAEQPVDKDFLRPLYGVEACCRTSIVYSPKDISCFWELSRKKRGQSYPEKTQREIDACLAIGANVLAYATNRELKDKLDAPQVATTGIESGSLQRQTLQVAKLDHNGGADDAPSALANLLRTTQNQLQLRVDPTKWLVPPDNPKLNDFPIAFIHGRRAFRYSAAQREALRTFVTNGGTVFGDSICASEAFTRDVKKEFAAIFPDATWSRIPSDHEMYSGEFGGADIRQVSVRMPRIRVGDGPLQTRTEKRPPKLEGIEIDGRWVVIFSPLDMSCAMENQTSLECKGYIRDDALRLGINILQYVMQN